ncbi:MAG: ATP-dependent DNA helicase, partial [Acidobacteria bacterium]|nr:ATP-dependent DNA helicase [Acidobacteriota bacterium]
EAPPARAARSWTREEAVAALLRDRLTMTGPVTAAALARSLGVSTAEVDAALVALESEGAVLRGRFTGASTIEWCDRRLLARMHRYTLGRLRAEIAPVTPADFMRHLFAWQHVDPSSVLIGPAGVRAAVAQLDGLELPARAWERDVLAARVERYDPAVLDMLCLTGQVGWARVSSGPTQVVSATPIALFLREHEDVWLSLRSTPQVALAPHATSAGSDRVLEHLRFRGASFAHDLAAACRMSRDEVHVALGELVAAGLVFSDGFAGLRSLIGGSAGPAGHGARPESAGRWFAVRPPSPLGGSSEASDTDPRVSRSAAVEALAWALLRRYGVLFRRVIAREALSVPWRDLLRVYRRLEARGEIRGGRFVSGMSGEQFALPEAVERLREVRRSGPDDRLIAISAADPLNFTGILTPGDRIRVAAGNRIVYRNGVPLAAMEGDMLRMLGEAEPEVAAEAAAAAAGRRVPVLSGYVGRL